MTFFKILDEFRAWAFGDPKAKTFETRKTFFEVLFGIFGFFAAKTLIQNFTGETV